MNRKRKQRRRGRPSKLTVALTRRICKLIARGLNLNQIADAVGIHRDTIHDWSQRFPDFSDALTRARARGIAKRLGRIDKAADKDWRADTWWLERQCPDQFGRRGVVLANHQPGDGLNGFYPGNGLNGNGEMHRTLGEFTLRIFDPATGAILRETVASNAVGVSAVLSMPDNGREASGTDEETIR